METHSDTPTIMMKTVTKFWFFKKRRQYFTIYNQVSQYLYKKMFACFYFCVPNLNVFQKHAFFSCFFLLFLHHLILPCPLSSLSSILFLSRFAVLQIFYRASIFTFLPFLKLLAHPFLQPPVTFHIYLCFSSSYLFLSLRSGN